MARLLLVAACAVVATLLAAPTVMAQPVEGIVSAAPARPAPPGALRARAVWIDVARLEAAAAARRPAVLELLPGFTVVTSPERVERRGPGRFTWFGTVQGGGRATLTVEGARVVGRVVTPRGLVLVEPAGDAHVAFEPAPGLEGGGNDAVPPPAQGTSGGDELLPDELFPDELHLAIFYTSQVADSLGDGVAVFVQATTDAMTDVLVNSDVPAPARLVYTGEVDHVETEELVDNLYQLQDPSDGDMDEVHDLRDAYSADLVALLVETGTNSATGCGVTFLMAKLSGSFEGAAFSVTKRRCAIAELVFPHELGHNLGLHHDLYVTSGPGLYYYSHGFVNADSMNVPEGRPGFRTVLAYERECTDVGGTCPRIPYYSNPESLFNGQVMGEAETADNARTARLSAPVAAAFRAPQRLTERRATTAGGPTWTRPACPDPADLSTCAPSDSATAVSYEAATFSVTRTGMHYVRSEAAFDGVLLLYEGAFDPAAPLIGLVGYAEPDPSAPPSRRLLLSAVLQTEAAYVLVTTGRTNADAGPFTNAVFGPRGGEVVGADEGPGAEPAAGAVVLTAPNPTRGHTAVSFALGEPGPMRLALYDVLGREVAVLAEGVLAAGPHEAALDAGRLPPGLYALRLTAGERTATRPLTVVR